MYFWSFMLTLSSNSVARSLIRSHGIGKAIMAIKSQNSYQRHCSINCLSVKQYFKSFTAHELPFAPVLELVLGFVAEDCRRRCSIVCRVPFDLFCASHLISLWVLTNEISPLKSSPRRFPLQFFPKHHFWRNERNPKNLRLLNVHIDFNPRIYHDWEPAVGMGPKLVVPRVKSTYPPPTSFSCCFMA